MADRPVCWCQSSVRTDTGMAPAWETTVTLQWLAQRLGVGTRGHLTHLLYWHDRKKPKPGRGKSTR